MDLHHLFPIFGIKNHLFRLNFSRKHLTNLFFVYATVMILYTNKKRLSLLYSRENLFIIWVHLLDEFLLVGCLLPSNLASPLQF